MLKFRKRNRDIRASDTMRPLVETNPDLRVRSLLEDPEVRRVMGIDVVEPGPVLATRRFDRRRLLQQAAA